MEKFAIGLALGCLGGALLTANNYKMRTLVRKGQEEVQSRLDKMMDEKIQTMDKALDNETQTDEAQTPTKKKKEK